MSASSRIRAGLGAAINDLPIQTDNRSDEAHLAAAVDWLCRSQDVTPNSGSAATYNLVLGWEPAYPETTGYIIPTIYAYAKVANAPDISGRATRMADWLYTVQHQSGSFPAGTGEDGEPSVFNTGQIVFGLVEAYHETGDERYRNAVQEACDWIVDQQTAAGYWDEYDYKNATHAYSTRVAWALLKGATILPKRNDLYRDAARRNFYWAIELQRPNGWFEKAGFEPGETPFLHTIAYTVRGLLEGGFIFGDQTILNAATQTADELLSLQQTGGILRGAYDSSWSPSRYYCLTGNAQMAIIWLRLFDHTGEHAYLTTARRTIEFLKRRQVSGGSAQIRGGLAGSYPLFGPYMYLRFPNWAVKFFADALLLARDSS